MADDRDARIAQLEAELERRDAALRQARAESAALREQQTATSEILRVIASSPTDLESVLTAIAESAAKLCGANDAIVHQLEDGGIRLTAAWGSIGRFPLGTLFPLDRGLPNARAILERQPVEMCGDPEDIEQEFPMTARLWRQFGIHANLAVPLLRDDSPIGAITIRRLEAVPFTDQQIALLETFADQAVIAIENARLFEELERRNQELSEALEQQTATAEILRVIASSPTQLDSVLGSIAAGAARLCEADDAVIHVREGDAHRRIAAFGSSFELPLGEVGPLSRATVIGRTILDGTIVNVDDLAVGVETEFSDARSPQRRFGQRSMLAAPCLGTARLSGPSPCRAERCAHSPIARSPS